MPLKIGDRLECRGTGAYADAVNIGTVEKITPAGYVTKWVAAGRPDVAETEVLTADEIAAHVAAGRMRILDASAGIPFDHAGAFRRRSRDYLAHRETCPSCQANFECAIARPWADDLHAMAADLDLPCPDCEPQADSK